MRARPAEILIGVIPGVAAHNAWRVRWASIGLNGDGADRRADYRSGDGNARTGQSSCPQRGASQRVAQAGENGGAQAPIAVRLAKESVLAAFETPLEEGLEIERKEFLSTLRHRRYA